MTSDQGRLTRRDRFRIKEQILDTFRTDEWELDRIQLLFSEFGLPMPDYGYDESEISGGMVGIDDTGLIELASIVLSVDEAEIAASAGLPPEVAKNWKPGYVRVFLSHSAKQKAVVAEIANELALVGIHGFVAHDTIEYTKPWQAQIESGLRSMEAFVAIVHPGFSSSPWCNQEIGWALGRRVPIYAVRVGADPSAFLGSLQWPNAAPNSPVAIARLISAWISGLPELGPHLADGLISELRSAGNYFDAEAAAKRIAALGSLTDQQFESIDEAWWSNDQLYGGYLPTNVMKPFYQSNGKEWPPPKPTEPDDEPPF